MKYLSGIIAAAATATTLSGTPQEAEAQSISIDIENGQITGLQGIFGAGSGSIHIDNEDGSVGLNIGGHFYGLTNGRTPRECRDSTVGRYNDGHITYDQYRQLMQLCSPRN